MEVDLHRLDLRYAPLRRTSARKERAVLGSLAEIGQQSPVVLVATEGASGGFILLDGYKRARALERLGRDTVRATVWTLAEPEALLLERVMRNAEADSALEQGWLLRELLERFELVPTEAARRFDKSTSWVSRRLALVRELPESIQERVRKGELAPHAAMKHLVPLARANRAEAEQLSAICAGRGLSTREVGALCAAWRSGTEATRALILEKPELVLRAQEEAQKARGTAPEARLLQDFAALSGIARRAARLVEDGGLPVNAREELQRVAQSARAETDVLFTLCRKELALAGPKHPDRHS